MNYLHESQGRTLSKTIEERKVVCRKGDGEKVVHGQVEHPLRNDQR